MGILRGIETLAIGRTKTVELAYEGAGQYVDRDGKPVKLQDATCYECMNNTFILESEPIDYCPHCGYRAGKVWVNYEKAREWAMTNDFAWMRKLGRVPFGARRSDGSWVLAFARKAEDLLRSGQFIAARELIIDDREVEDVQDAGAGWNAPSGGDRSPSAFGGGANDHGGFSRGGGGLEID